MVITVDVDVAVVWSVMVYTVFKSFKGRFGFDDEFGVFEKVENCQRKRNA